MLPRTGPKEKQLTQLYVLPGMQSVEYFKSLSVWKSDGTLFLVFDSL